MLIRATLSFVVTAASACLLVAVAYAVTPPPREIALTFGIFQAMCIDSNGSLTNAHPPLADLISKGVAKELTDEEVKKSSIIGKGWAMAMGENGARHQFLLTQNKGEGEMPKLCTLHSTHGSSADMRSTLEHLTGSIAASRNLKTAHLEKPLLGNPYITFDLYEFFPREAPGPAIMSLSTTDKPIRPMRHQLVYQPAQ